MYIDNAIFISFLIINLIVGLYFGKGIKNIREYAIGDRNFSTATIVSTIIATWVSGNSFGMAAFDSHDMGIFFIIPGLADAISFFLIGFFIAPRISEFLGCLSVAEAMGNLYGRQVRIITSVSAIIPAIGSIAIQFVILTSLLSHFLNTSGFIALIISSFIVISYSVFGGIKAVTFTDMIQFFTFGVVIPMTAFIIWQAVGDIPSILTVLDQNPIFDYRPVFDYKNVNFLNTIFVFLFFLIPGLDPALFQRIVMAKNTIQVSKSFIISGLIIFFGLYLTFYFIGVLLIADNGHSLDPNNLIKYILDKYMDTGFKGMFVVGVAAMIMSTADSYINCAAVLFTHDFCKTIGLKINEKNELKFVRLSALLIGVCALCLSLYSKNLLDLILSTYSFYMPIVSVPLLMAIFGFRTSTTSVMCGMLAGFLVVISFKLFSNLDSLMPGMIANWIFLVGCHYVLQLLYSGSKWIDIKDHKPLSKLKAARSRKISKISKTIKSFNLIKFCINNLPKEEKIFVYFGVFSIISIFSNTLSLSKNIPNYLINSLSFVYYIALVFATIFITYPLWFEKVKSKKAIALIWNIAVFFNLAFINVLFAISSKFSSVQITILMANFITIAVLMRWYTAILMIASGVITGTEFYKKYIGLEFFADDSTLQFKLIHSLILINIILIAFLKPKQEYQELTEEKNEHLNKRIGSQEKQVKEALALRSEFIRNINHEYHAPMTGITSLAETLDDSYDKLTETQRREAVKIILKSSRKLDIFDSNLSALSELSKAAYKLHIEAIDFSDLVYNRIEICRKLYEENKENRDFILDIQIGILIKGDRNYLSQMLDNLIINAISYCKKGKISILLKQSRGANSFIISDEGIGIPKEELFDIFNEFTVSSKTKSSAGGRGIGLALCKRVIEVHNGMIKAKSDGLKGATFTIDLPL